MKTPTLIDDHGDTVDVDALDDSPEAKWWLDKLLSADAQTVDGIRGEDFDAPRDVVA